MFRCMGIPRSVFLVFTIASLLVGCKSSKNSCGPLKNIHKYQVILFVSPSKELDPKKIADSLKEKLALKGEVIEGKIPITVENPVLFITLEPRDSFSSSSIRVIGKVQVEENGCELTSVLWSYPYESPASYIPVEENDKISFAEKRKILEFSGDPLDTLILSFIEEYQKANAQKDKPIFLISE